MASSSTSASNPNPWAPYDTYKDCSQGICSIYCPQWCYIIFPPPPPPFFDDSAATDFSPLIIAVIGIIASAFILVCYYTIISKYCRRRRHGDGDGDTTSAVEFHDNQSVNNDAWRGGNNGGGLDEGLIKSITVYKYKKGEGLVEESDCSVCLSEFLEDESLRLLPKCNHAFHLPCIDTWLKSHSNCPLCRANIIAQTPAPAPAPAPDHPPPPPPGQETPVTRPDSRVVSVNQYQHRNDETVLVIHEEIVGEQAVLNDGDDEIIVHTSTSDDQVGVEVLPIRRSVSLNSYSGCRGPVLVADILRNNEEEEDDGDYQMDKNRSNRVMNLVMNSPLALKRSISTGRFMFSRFGKSSSVNNSIIPN